MEDVAGEDSWRGSRFGEALNTQKSLYWSLPVASNTARRQRPLLRELLLNYCIRAPNDIAPVVFSERILVLAGDRHRLPASLVLDAARMVHTGDGNFVQN